MNEGISNYQDGKGPRTHERAAGSSREWEYKDWKGRSREESRKEARAYKSSRAVVGGMVVFKYLTNEDGQEAHQRISRSVSHTTGASVRPRKGIVRSPQQEQAQSTRSRSISCRPEVDYLPSPQRILRFGYNKLSCSPASGRFQ